MFTIEDALQPPVDTKDEIPKVWPITINPDGVVSLLLGLRATGPDDIPAYLLKETAIQFAPSLT